MGMDGSLVLSSVMGDGDCQIIYEFSPSSSTKKYFIQVETEAMKKEVQDKLASLTNNHNTLLRVLIGELQS